MGLQSLTSTPLYIPPQRNAVRVRIRRGGVWHDITNRVSRGVVQHNNDNPVGMLELTLLNGEGFDSLVPSRKDSPLNWFNEGPRWTDIAHLGWSDIAHLKWTELPGVNRYYPLLGRYNEVLVEAATSTDGEDPTDFVPVFHGLLGDKIKTTKTSREGAVVIIRARDFAKRLQDDVIIYPVTFRNMYASQIIQALLEQRFGPGAVPLRVLGDDDYWVREVTFEYIDTWRAIQTFCERSDKDVRFLLNETTNQMELTYWTPSLEMTPVWSIDGGTILQEDVETGDASLRHGVIVRFIDENGQRQEVQVIDPTLRRDNEPLRISLIEEGDTSTIRDMGAATRLANAIFSSLKTKPSTSWLRIPFNPYMRIYDVIQVENPSIRSEEEVYSISEIQLHFTKDQWWTEVTASESVKVRHGVWLEKEAKQGVKAPLTPQDSVTRKPMSKPTGVTVTGVPGGLAVRFDPPVGEEYMRWWESEVHVSTDPNFVLGPFTRVASGQYTYFEITSGLEPGTTYYVRVVHVDMSLNRSEPSDAASGRVALISEGIVDPDIFSITPSSDPEPSSGRLEDLWDMDPTTGVTFPSAPITITFRYPVYQGSDLVDLHLSAASSGYVQMRNRDTGQWVNVLGSPTTPVLFTQGWNRVPFDDHRLYFGREYRLVLLSNVQVNELRFERVTVADKILAGTLRLTGDMAITNETGTVWITSRGIEMDANDQGGTQWSPGGLVFRRPDGTKSGYLRAVVPGTAQDGDFVPLNFVNEPVVVLSPARAIMYDPSVGSLQKLRLEAVDVSPEGFRVVAKLVRHDGAGQRIVFPETEKYRWGTYGIYNWCTDGGHASSQTAARAWSEHRLRDVEDKKVFVTSSGTTGVIIRVREMLHAHAWAGDYSATNYFSYRIRLRPVGSPSWTHTLGPFSRSIRARSSLFDTRLEYRHSRVSHIIENLSPDEYEIEIEVVGKSLSSNGANTDDSVFLLVEEIEEMQEVEIPTPEPIVVHYVAFESDSAGDDEE